MPVILALRALGLGDLLTALPALRGLRRGWPRAELVLAAPAVLAPLVGRLAVADRLLAMPSAVTAPPSEITWSVPPPALAVNLHGAGPQSTEALRRLGPAELWSYGVTGSPPWDAGEHEVRRWSRLVEAYGCATRPDDLFIAPPGPRSGPVVIHPGAAGAARRWPPRRYAEVAAALAARGLPVRISAGPGERDLAGLVASLAGLPTDAVIADIDLNQLIELILGSRLVVCGDTGVAHLASAGRTPSVVLFGPQPPARWGPPPGPHIVLWHPALDDTTLDDTALDDGAEANRPHPALLRVTVPEVLDAAAALLTPRSSLSGVPG